MKKLIISILTILCMNTIIAADGWLTNFEEAKKEAESSKKLILVDFSGSDWCKFCIMLDREVFSTPEFKKFAAENLILLLVDFPRAKGQAEDLLKNNRKLAKKYKIEGYPTVLLLNHNGEELARTGYMKGGADAYVKHLKDLVKNITQK